MDKTAQSCDIVLLFDQYSEDSRKLHVSFQRAGYECPVLVMEDDGFLPEHVISIYGFFLGDYEKAEGILGRPRYFNQIKVPEYWEISGTNRQGKVHDLHRERGKIFYAEPVHRRLVQVVDWYDEKIETARRMLGDGTLSLDKVAEISDLPIEVIRKLAGALQPV